MKTIMTMALAIGTLHIRGQLGGHQSTALATGAKTSSHKEN